MANIIVRGLDDDLLTQINSRAEAANMSREEYIRQLLTQAPSKLVLRRMRQMPSDQQSILANRLEDVARKLHQAGFSKDDAYQACLLFGGDIVEELRLTADPPLPFLSRELLITDALIKAMQAYENSEKLAKEQKEQSRKEKAARE